MQASPILSPQKVTKSPQNTYLFHLKRRLLRHSQLIRVFLICLIALAISYSMLLLAPNLIAGIGLLGRPLRLATAFLAGPQGYVSQINDRVNLVFLGFSDPSKAGKDLTDTIILFSLNTQSGDLLFFSIPRDIWVDSLKAKLNTAYHYGEAKKPGGGGATLAKSSVSKITGQPVDYYLTMDFGSFVKAIDAVGGIDLEVKSGFDDFLYPIPGKEEVFPESDRYEHIRFDPGFQHMDGQTALKYIRSRNATGEEGSDFARSGRQKSVILAFKDKALSREIILNRKALENLSNVLRRSVRTDLTPEAIASLGKILLKTVKLTPRTVSISQFLTNPPASRYNGQYVLVPPANEWKPVREFIACSINQFPSCPAPSPAPLPVN